MSIESRLSNLQSRVEQLVQLTKARHGEDSRDDDCDTSLDNYPPASVFHKLAPQAEIRCLELWRGVVSECLGTLLYVFFVCAVSIPWTGHFPPFLSVAFVSAVAYGALTWRVFPRAHLNPVFTVAAVVLGKVTGLRALLFAVGQAGGAVAGAAILYGLTVPGYQGTLGATTIASHIEPVQAFGLELILTFVLVLTYVSDASRTGNCVATSCMLLAGNLVAIPCTGGSLNPVRSLGPAFVMNKWPRHWVFWFGPLLGALMAAYLHRYILRRDYRKGRRGHGDRDRERAVDGVSLDIPHGVGTGDRDLIGNAESGAAAVLDRLLSPDTRFHEPIYGGTRSLYMKPSPLLPRTNLHRSHSVYASKRYVDGKFEAPSAAVSSNAAAIAALATPGLNRRKATPMHQHQQLLQAPDVNYEAVYNRNPSSLATTTNLSSKGGLLHTVSPSVGVGPTGPASYESAYFKTYSTPAPASDSKTHSHSHTNSLTSHGHGHGRLGPASTPPAHNCQHSGNHHGHNHHAHSHSISSTASSVRERETNRILAQYELALANASAAANATNPPAKISEYESTPAKGMQLNPQIKSIYYERERVPAAGESMRRHNALNYKETHPEKKLQADTSCSSESSNGSQGDQTQGNSVAAPHAPPRFRPPIQIPIEEAPLQQQNHGHGQFGNDLSGRGGHGLLLQQPQARKPYEHLDGCKKMLEYAPNSKPSHEAVYVPRILAAEKDATAAAAVATYGYAPQHHHHQHRGNHGHDQQQQQQLTFSYH